MSAVPGHEVWDGLVGHELPVTRDAGAAADAGPWRCAACSPLTTGGGWDRWSVTFDAPGVVAQGTVMLTTPDGSTVPVFAVPQSASPLGTRLVATFTTPAPDRAGPAAAPAAGPDSDSDHHHGGPHE